MPTHPEGLYYMHLANWRPHQKGEAARNQEWSPEEWRAFATASQIFLRRPPKKNRGTKRKQWWQDKQCGRDPNRRRRQQQECAENSAESPIEVAVQPPADVPADAGDVAPTEAKSAPTAAAPAAAAPPAAPAPKPRPTSMVLSKARPQGPPPPPPARFHGPVRPTVVNPNPISPFGDSPCFAFHFQSTTRTIVVPKAVALHLCSGFTFQESTQHMQAVFPTPDGPKAFQVYQRPPAILVEDDTSDEEYINPQLLPVQWPDDELPPGAGGSSSSKDPA